jgi:hypothetical protein
MRSSKGYEIMTINDEYCWMHDSPNGGWTCQLCAVDDTNQKAQQAKAKAEKTSKTVTKEVAPGLVYKIKVRKESHA